MQIQTFTIPILGGEALSDEMNVFLRSKKILSVDRQFVSNDQGAFWCFCISFLDDRDQTGKTKIDYRKILDEEAFKRFSRMREIRKELAQQEAIPPYAVFSDEELASMAKLTPLTPAGMKSIKGIGDKKVEKYGQYFMNLTITDEASRPSDRTDQRSG